jgi:predicted O-methyltransferase YrrM
VKVGAYLTQQMGFTNVSRLAGGIIAYDRTLSENSPSEKSLFRGTNFVFDGRLGRPITDDELGPCITCGASTSLVSNCFNGNCHQRMIQCADCKEVYHGTCSEACCTRVMNIAKRSSHSAGLRMLPLDTEHESGNTVFAQSERRTNGSTAPFDSTIDNYIVEYSTPPPLIYDEIEANTKSLIPTGSHMVSGKIQGRLLTHLASMTREGRILELGTFTGYATTCLLEGAMNAARFNPSHGSPLMGGGPFVLTLERDINAFNIAVAHLSIVARHGLRSSNGVQAARALREAGGVAETTQNEVTLVCDESIGASATCQLRRVSDALAVVEAMASGRWSGMTGSACSPNEGESEVVSPFDMVFLDADKTRMLDYMEALLENDHILKSGGIIVVDNVLWKGLVVDAASSMGFATSLSSSKTVSQPSWEATTELKQNRRARKLANKMHQFNRAMAQDPRVEVVVIPVRDGLSILRKKYR